jgi:hypothetical protein
MPLDRHLTGPELVRLAEPDALDVRDAAGRAHVGTCAVCRDRLDALRREEDALAAALADFDAEAASHASSDEEHARLDALTDRMMARLRDDVAAGVVPMSSAGTVVAPRRTRWGGRRPWAWTAALGAAAAGLVLLLGRRAPVDVAPHVAQRAHETAPPDAPSQVGSSPTVVRPSPADTTRLAVTAPRPPHAGHAVSRPKPVEPDTTLGEEDVTRGVTLVPSIEVQIERVVARYADALAAGDTAHVRALFPALGDDSLRALAAAPARPSLALRPHSVRQLSADQAEAVVRDSVATTVGAQPARDLVYSFRRDPSGWVIVGTRPGAP